MRYIFIVLLIFITNSCQTSSSTPDSYDPSIPPTFPDLEVNSWTYLNSSKNLSIRVVANEHITVSDNNTPYISFTMSSKLYVYRWSGNDWIQVGKEIALETGSTHDSLITYNNIPYITYKNNVKKFENNAWVNALNNISLPTGETLNSLSLYIHKENLYLTYISDSDKKLHIKYLENSSWKPYGETPVVLDPRDGFSGSMNNGIQMAFYNNTPYIALKNFNSSIPQILVLNNDNWEFIPIGPPDRDSVNSDYFFYIDSSGTMYLSFLSGGFVPTVGSFQLFKKSMSATSWQKSTPFENNIFGYQTVLYDNQLYIVYSHSENRNDYGAHIAGKVQFNRFSSSLGLEDTGKNIVSDDSSTGMNVKLAIKDSRIFAMYLDFNKGSIVVKSALLK